MSKEEFLKSLESENKEEVRGAIEALAKFDSPDVIRAMVETAKRVRSKSVLEAVKCSLLSMKSEGLCKEVLKLFEESEPKLFQLAIDVLTNAGNRCLGEIEEKLLRSPDPNMRKFALDILAGIGTEEALELIGSMIEDEDPNVRNTAVEYLRNFSGFKEKVAGLLIKAMDSARDLYSITTLASTIIYGNVQDERLIEPLKELATSVEDPLMKHWIYKCLLFLRDSSVVKPALENARKIGAVSDIEKDIRIFGLEES